MQLHRGVAASSVALILAVLLLSPTTDAFDVTLMLNKHPEFSTFSHYLSVTELAPEINRRRTITVCAVDNAGMADLLSKHLTLGGIKNVLAYHVLLDYFDAKKLHQITNGSALAATMYQATGSAAGSSGFINITDLSRGKVGFSPKDNGGIISATLVKSVEAKPYDISIIQISNLLPSYEAQAPAPAPSLVNITKLMSAHGCKVFADTLSSSPAETTFEDNINSGLTILCPGDDAMKAFLPKYKNLTAADQQSLLEYHGIPIYYSLSDLRSNNGLTGTLAAVGNKYFFTVQNDGTVVTIITKLVTAKIVTTLVDNPPLSILQVNKVLMPPDLSTLGGLAPAPAPGPAANSPKSSKSKHNSPPAPPGPSDSPADAPDGDVADQNSSGARVLEIGSGFLGALILTVCSPYLQF
ncbi:fasciclin-like arabinogalactan protein 1-like [Dorcoceras hygrometricum]|uniref:Fasciclin-like arabinogalactan protein 1-like n=1 Tax=Dorcoceras hygrometricum TaxID=472368 RepID=A0A2Z7BNL9_9LAMI|nr:fasciclin-like arabinogalactan protein 1-like [Dorcoceras hygrometricum]